MQKPQIREAPQVVVEWLSECGIIRPIIAEEADSDIDAHEAYMAAVFDDYEDDDADV